MQLGEASKVVPVDKLSVIIAIVLHEPMNWHPWVGGALVVRGAIVIALG